MNNHENVREVPSGSAGGGHETVGRTFLTDPGMPDTRNALVSTVKKVNAAGRVALCGYFLAGYPSPRTFYETVRRGIKLDAIEFGIPAVNPVLDGPVISSAHELVINQRGMDAETSLALIGGLNDLPQPRFVMTYSQDGRALDGFLRKCVENDIHGVFAPDIGQEEAAYVASIARALHLAYVGFIDENASAEEVERKAAMSDILYLKTSRGYTGERAILDGNALANLSDMIGRIRCSRPGVVIAAGIGIQHAEQVRQLARLQLDMIIVGTRLMEHLSLGDGRMAEYIESLHQASYRI